MIGETLADRAEEIVRNLRKAQIRQFLVGDPLIGGMVGFLAFWLAQLASVAGSPYDLIGMVSGVVIVLALCDLNGRRLEEPIGDAANRGLTRVYGIGWVPFRARRSIRWDCEPWRTTFIGVFMLFVVEGIPSASFDLSMLVVPAWVTSVTVGVALAVLKDFSSSESRKRLFGRAEFNIEKQRRGSE